MHFRPSIFLYVAFTILSSAGSSRIKLTAPVMHSASVGNFKKVFLYIEELERILLDRKATRFTVGKSGQGRNIDAFFFPGTSNKRALVIGGVHGSELSSIEVATELLAQLRKGDSIYYNVIIIPSLFPDNEALAKEKPSLIGGIENVGRYSYRGAVDPNRQMPTPGTAFNEEDSLDHAGRKIESENAILLELIDQYRPQRIVNLHAIRNTGNAGVYADPRTDHEGIALGYDTDSSLAITIAKNIYNKGGYIPGNRVNTKPTALYYKDPVPAAPGFLQKRNMSGSPMPGHRGGGVSLGTWASTAVKNEDDATKNRDAIRIITMEFPGSKRPVDHKKEMQAFYRLQVQLYASALKSVFLGEYYTENDSPSPSSLANLSVSN